MSHITSGRISLAELREVDGVDKAGLSGCNQSQMWSSPCHGGPTTSAVSVEERGEGVTAGRPLTQSKKPRARADSCLG